MPVTGESWNVRTRSITVPGIPYTRCLLTRKITHYLPRTNFRGAFLRAQALSDAPREISRHRFKATTFVVCAPQYATPTASVTPDMMASVA